MAKSDIYNLTKDEFLNEMDLYTHAYDSNDYILIITNDIVKSQSEESDVECIDIQLLNNNETTFLGRFILEEKYYINYHLSDDKLLILGEKAGKIKDVLLYYDILDQTNIVVSKKEALSNFPVDPNIIDVKNIDELLVNNDPERKRRQK